MPNVDLSLLKSLQNEVMDDLCNIYHVSLSSGTYGNTVEARDIFVSGVPCGIKFTNGQVVSRGQVMLVDYDVVLRIADDIPVLTTDEFDLVQKGDFVVSGTFNVYSAPVVNSSVQHVNLKRQAP